MSVGNYLLNISLRLILSIFYKTSRLIALLLKTQELEGRLKMAVFFGQILRDFSKFDHDLAELDLDFTV